MKQKYFFLLSFLLLCSGLLHAQNSQFFQGGKINKIVSTQINANVEGDETSIPAEIAIHLLENDTKSTIDLSAYISNAAENTTYEVLSNNNESAIQLSLEGAKLKITYSSAEIGDNVASVSMKIVSGATDLSTSLKLSVNKDMNNILFWAGEGANQTIMRVKWTVSDDELMWGYKWDGAKTGEDMILAIAKGDPRFFTLATTGTQYGTAFGGFGYDADKKDPILLVKEGAEGHVNENGIVVTTTNYDFENWTTQDADDYWNSGWMNGFWSYYIRDTKADDWGFSGVGASGRNLKHGMNDGWVYVPMGQQQTPVDANAVAAVPDKAPVVKTEIDDIYLPINSTAVELNLADYFADADGDKVSYSFTSSDNDILDISLTETRLNIKPKTGKEGQVNLTVTATAYGKNVSDVFIVDVKDYDYTKGMFVVNEDWFGHDLGTVNYLNEDGKFVYRVFRKENEGKKFGVTTQFGAIYGDRFYFVSKQGPRFVVADANTMKEIKSFEAIVENETGQKTDGRAFTGITPEKGYLTTSKGIHIYNIANDEFAGKIDGISEQIGNVLCAGKYAFAVSSSKVYVIDIETDAVAKTIGGGSFGGLARTKDGFVWVGMSSKILKINPTNLETEEVSLPSGVKTANSWGAWNANSFCASTTENTIYWSVPGSMFGGSNKIYRYNVGDASSMNSVFITLPSGMELYGAGVRVHPITNKLYVTGKKSGWGNNSLTNILYVYDGSTGDLLEEYPMESYYWFPALPVFPDAHAPMFNMDNISLTNVTDKQTYNLQDLASDADNLNCAIQFKLSANSNEDLADVKIENGQLEITPAEEAYGTADLKIKVISNGKIIEKTIQLSIQNDRSPIVKNAIQDIEKKEDAATHNLNLSEVFFDADGDEFTYSLTNSNEDLVTVSVDAGKLNFVYVADAFGEANITVTARANGVSVQDEFKLTVTSVDDAPVVINAIEDKTVEEDANDIVIPLDNVFSDIDGDVFTYAVSSSNEYVVKAVISSTNVELSLVENTFAEVDVTVTATSNGVSIKDEFIITVTPVDDAPVVNQDLDDITVNENAAKQNIDLSSVFTDIDDDDAKITIAVKSNSNESLVKAKIDGFTLKLEYLANQNGKAEIVLEATSNGKTVTTKLQVTVNAATGIVDVESLSISLSPNPNNGVFRIELNNDMSCHVAIYNLNGQQVYYNEVYTSRQEINLNHLSAGTYLVNLYHEKGVKRIKFMKK